MNFELNLIMKLILALFLVFVVGKILGTFFQNFFHSIFNPRKKNPHKDLDYLIEKQKMLLGEKQGKSLLSGQKANQEATEKEKVSKTKHWYQKQLKKFESQSSEYQEAKKVLILMDNASWGEGKSFLSIKEQLTNTINFTVDITTISKAVNQLICGDFYISLNSPDLPSYSKIIEVTNSKIVLNICLEEIENGKELFLSRLARDFEMQASCISKGIQYLIGKETIDEEKLIHSILENNLSPLTLQSNSDKILISEDRKQFTSLDNLLEKIKDSANLFTNLTYIPLLNGKEDLDKALELFNANASTPLDKIDKIYKKLAMQKHPDRLGGKNLSPALMKIAGENFTNLQKAYDIIKNYL